MVCWSMPVLTCFPGCFVAKSHTILSSDTQIPLQSREAASFTPISTPGHCSRGGMLSAVRMSTFACWYGQYATFVDVCNKLSFSLALWHMHVHTFMYVLCVRMYMCACVRAGVCHFYLTICISMGSNIKRASTTSESSDVGTGRCWCINDWRWKFPGRDISIVWRQLTAAPRR